MKKYKLISPIFPICGRHFENLYGLRHYHGSDKFNDTLYVNTETVQPFGL